MTGGDEAAEMIAPETAPKTAAKTAPTRKRAVPKWSFPGRFPVFHRGSR
jgi:hypothetical protein